MRTFIWYLIILIEQNTQTLGFLCFGFFPLRPKTVWKLLSLPQLSDKRRIRGENLWPTFMSRAANAGISQRFLMGLLSRFHRLCFL